MGADDAGFGIVSSLFAREELAPVIDAIGGATTRRGAGARHLLPIPAVHRLAAEPRLLQLARQFLGGSPTPFKATLFDKSKDSNWLVVWHQDTALPVKFKVAAAGWGPWSEKAGLLYGHAPAEVLAQIVALRVHFDDSAADNGPLRVLPGTHTDGRLSDWQIAQLAQEVAPVDCVVGAGGVLAMRPLIVHASSKSRSASPRRVLPIEYVQARSLSAGIELAVA